ncbi:hypothetical protein [Nostoc sp. ChiVER01]|nr:hypothetical protein [Nostoc sp. ChiVER01]MDZ8222576.1 hypothetical protein [Nostoc sp. ChiVER01]
MAKNKKQLSVISEQLSIISFLASLGVRIPTSKGGNFHMGI